LLAGGGALGGTPPLASPVKHHASNPRAQRELRQRNAATARAIRQAEQRARQQAEHTEVGVEVDAQLHHAKHVAAQATLGFSPSCATLGCTSDEEGYA
jgi:hypothetical protein